jgi:hypothetical protein
MPSRIQTTLAVALSLGLCLLFSIAILLGIVYRQHRQHRQHQQYTERTHADLSELRKQLKSSQQASRATELRSGPLDKEICSAFVRIYVEIREYIYKWIDCDRSSPQFNDSISRIEALLFPEPAEKHHLNVNKDTRMFRNPHNYTSAEIKVYLEQVDTRMRIA